MLVWRGDTWVKEKKKKGTLFTREVEISFNQILILLQKSGLIRVIYFLIFFFFKFLFVGGTIFNFLKIAQTSAFQPPTCHPGCSSLPSCVCAFQPSPNPNPSRIQHARGPPREDAEPSWASTLTEGLSIAAGWDPRSGIRGKTPPSPQHPWV